VPHPERVAQRSRRASKTSRARCARIGKAPRPVLAAGVFDLSNSESPQFIGRAVAALAGDPEVLRWSGQVVVAATNRSVIGPPAASLVEANRIEGVPAIGRQAEHSADAVCRVAYASLTEYPHAATEAEIRLARQRSGRAGRRLHHLEPTRLHEATTRLEN
jgi:hypothetical protein